MTLDDIANWDGLTDEPVEEFSLTTDWFAPGRELSIIWGNDAYVDDWVSDAPTRRTSRCVIKNRPLVTGLQEAGYDIAGDLETWDFLVRHEVIANSLHQAIEPLKSAMGADFRPRLRADRDEDGCKLLVLVPPSPADDLIEAMSRLDAFYDQWWAINMDEFGLTVLISIG